MTERRRAVITGMGVVAPGALDVETLFRRLVAGASSIGPIRRFDASGFPSRIAGEVTDVDSGPYGRIASFALAAADQAVTQAQLAGGRVGVVVAAGLGSYDHDEAFGPLLARPGAWDGADFNELLLQSLKEHSMARRTPGTVSRLVAERFGFTGPVMSVMTACAGGTQAIGDALRWIRNGTVDVAVAGGSDSELYPMGLASFCLLGALSTRNDEPMQASRPFDARRDGFVIGEGAGVLVLEEREHALLRGAPILAEVSGFGAACDAYRVTDPHPDGVGAVLAMRRAISDAGLSPREIDYVNAHGTSTPANDRIETLALKAVLGTRAHEVPISSTKSMIGHLTVAAGAVEAVVTALTLAGQTIHPTINLTEKDPDCDLDYVPGAAREAKVNAALSSSFAFGGQTACLVLTRGAA